MTTAEATRQHLWQDHAVQQLDELNPPAEFTHAVVHFNDDQVKILDVCENEQAATVSSEDWATKVDGGGEVAVHTVADIRAVGNENVNISAPEIVIDGDALIESSFGQFAMLVGGQRPSGHKLAIGGKIEIAKALLKGAEVHVKIFDDAGALIAAAPGTVTAIAFTDKTDKDGFVTTTREQKITLEAE